MLSLKSALYVRVHGWLHRSTHRLGPNGLHLHTGDGAQGLLSPLETSDAAFTFANERQATRRIGNRLLCAMALARLEKRSRDRGADGHREPTAPDDEPSPQPVDPDQGPAPAHPGETPPLHAACASGATHRMAPLRRSSSLWHVRHANRRRDDAVQKNR
jgi:hypothetical protein